MPSRPASHSRGASELISSDRKNGHGSFLSISAPQEDGGVPTPGPSRARRGHAHRRSAAISCGDLSFLVKPQTSIPPVPALPASVSAPTTPADEAAASSASGDSTVQTEDEKENTTQSEPAATTTPPRKAGRVGFSDTIEFIPRPLSLVSSDASSTMTIRQGHSVSNSISSIASISSPSPPAKEYRGFPMAARSTETDHARPSTAGPVLGNTKSHESLCADDDEAAMRRSSDPPKADPSVLSSATYSPRGQKSYKFYADSPSSNVSPHSSRTVSASSHKLTKPFDTYHTSNTTHGFSNPLPDGYADMPRLARKTSSTRGSIKQKKKVKSWAGSILSRKAKPRSSSASKKQKASKRTPTPPMQNYEPELSKVNAKLAQVEVDQTPEIDLDDAYAPESSPVTTGQSDFANWKPRHIPTHDDEDSSSPIIDLDAALGPFNTPTHDQAWREAQGQTAARRKRNMHSQAGMKNFTGPGLHYHRRAESAPALVPFENPRFGASSGSVMEDVFEEEEEDDWEEVKTVSHKGSTIKNDEDEAAGLGIEIKVVDAENGHDTMDWTNDKENDSLRGLKRKTSALSDMESIKATGPATTFASSSSPLRETFNMDDFAPPPRIGDDCYVQRPQSSSRSSTSSMTPPVRSDRGKEFPILENHTFVGQPPWLTPTTPNSNTFTQSPFPSPRSRLSQDTARQSTAPSSILEEPGFNPLWLGEPGPEIRMSVDDVPSLTSSNSTMTRESMANVNSPGYGNSQFRNGQRSSSLSGPAAQAVQRKRGSIASLSRLLSSHGSEKSKLSIESTAAQEDGLPRKDKNKRMSRIMSFWKPKNREPTP